MVSYNAVTVQSQTEIIQIDENNKAIYNGKDELIRSFIDLVNSIGYNIENGNQQQITINLLQTGFHPNVWSTYCTDNVIKLLCVQLNNRLTEHKKYVFLESQINQLESRLHQLERKVR